MTAASAPSAIPRGSIQKRREAGTLPELRNAQLDRNAARFPVPVAVALGRPERRLLAISGAGSRAHLHLRQPLGGKADHPAKKISIRALLPKRPQVHHLVGQRWSLQKGGCRNQTLRESTDDHPAASYTRARDATFCCEPYVPSTMKKCGRSLGGGTASNVRRYTDTSLGAVSGVQPPLCQQLS